MILTTDTFVILTHYMRAQGHVLEERIRFLFYISDFDEGTWLLVYTQNGSLES